MKEVKGFIRIGFFEDFDGENSILITADFNGLLQLEKAFEKLSEGKKDITISKLELIDQQFKENILAISDYENIGLLLTNGNGFEWRLKPEKWNEFKEKIVTLYSSNDGGHHYLDSDSKDNNDLQVILSFKEQIYDLPFWNQFKT